MGNLLKGRVAIITGSGQGIGKDLAVWMAAQGCKVITNNRKKGSPMQAHEGKTVLLNEDDKKKLSAIIGDAESAAEAVNTNPDVIAAGGEAFPVYADITKLEDCKKLVDTAIEKWGRLDILVNNAAATWTGNIKEMKPENWEVCVRSKLDSSFYLIYYALPHMVKQHYGRILLASSEGQLGLAGMCAYSAACGGVAAMTRGAGPGSGGVPGGGHPPGGHRGRRSRRSEASPRADDPRAGLHVRGGVHRQRSGGEAGRGRRGVPVDQHGQV